ncbi:MAG: VOC family protein [Candidatus Helarchaeota archaeon]|nr:VOC family protein [Candidatus Helarchaeota archaeon]
MTVNFLPLVHVEITVPDAEEAYRILHDVLGAEKVQEDLAKFLDGDVVKVIHVGLGDVVLQFIEPKLKYIEAVDRESSWYNQLETKGPGVHNLTFGLENVNEAVKELEKEGIVPLFTFELEWGNLIPSAFLNPDAKTVYMMDSMERLGFHLEFAENPFKKGVPLPQTRYVTGSDNLIGSVSPMIHIELVTPDAEKTYELLHKVFGSEKVEIEFANFLDSPFMKVIHVNLSNVVLQYCQPIVKQLSWYELLQKNGTYVHNITFTVENIQETVEKFKKEGITPLLTIPLDWSKLNEDFKSYKSPVYMMNTLEKLGFHLELGQTPTGDELEFFSKLLFIDLKGALKEK